MYPFLTQCFVCPYFVTRISVYFVSSLPTPSRVDGNVILPGGPRSSRAAMERNRPLDMITVLDGMERLSTSEDCVDSDPRFAGRVDCNNTAVTGMSFGGFTAAACLELGDPRIRAAVLKCPSIRSGNAAHPGRPPMHIKRTDRTTPVMVMMGGEENVLGMEGNRIAADYIDGCTGEKNKDGLVDAFYLEIIRGGHVSFTSCEMYDQEYGNGIGRTMSCTSPRGGMYRPLDIVKQHTMINSYGLAFLNAYLREGKEEQYATPQSSIQTYNRAYLGINRFSESGELLFRRGKGLGETAGKLYISNGKSKDLST